jgi:phage baseplate assembly protein gpV
MCEFDIAELYRRLNNIVRFGAISHVDYDNALVRVKLGDITTHWLHWLTHRAAGDVSWHAPEIGEQVLVLSPAGELNQGVCLPAIYQNNHPAPETDSNISMVRFADDALFEYNRTTHHLRIMLPQDGKVTFGADVFATGDITDHTRSMQADRNIYNSHHHTGDSGGTTSVPGEQQ